MYAVDPAVFLASYHSVVATSWGDEPDANLSITIFDTGRESFVSYVKCFAVEIHLRPKEDHKGTQYSL